MKQARYGTTPIPMPKIPSGITGLPSFANEVLKSLRALRDRSVVVPSDSPRLSRSHPFKVSPNGDDTVNVAPGNVIDFTTSGNGIYDSNAVTGDFNAYAGGDVTITASGTLFLVITYDNTNVIAQDSTFNLATYALTVTSMAVELDPTLSSLELSIPIAEVELTDSVASVTNQILTHNPILQLGFAEGLTP